MNKAKEPAIKANIGHGLEAHFNSIDDFLILAATQPFEVFTGWWVLVHADSVPTKEDYKKYRTDGTQERLSEVLLHNFTSDNRTLYEALNEKNKKRRR